MNTRIVKQLISNLNSSSFSKFIFELWSLSNTCEKDRIIDTYSLKEIGEDAYEQVVIYRSKGESNDLKGYSLILPFTIPIDVFNTQKEDNFLSQPLLSKIKKYKRVINLRKREWYWPQDGEYVTPTIAFVSNIAGKNHSYYYTILQYYKRIFDVLKIEAEPIFGSCDSFIELNKTGTFQALKNFYESERKGIVVSLNQGEVNLSEFFSEKHSETGVLKNTYNPIEPAYILKSQSEIIKEFESIIDNKPNELVLQKFITRYYREIFGDHYTNIETEIWLKFPETDINTKNRRIDIFLRNSLQNDWELFELKRPIKIVASYRNDIPMFTSALTGAVEQLKNYGRILSDSKVKKVLAKHGIEYFEPELKLIMGRSKDIKPQQWRYLKKNNENGLKITSYDELLNEMKIRYENQLNIW